MKGEKGEEESEMHVGNGGKREGNSIQFGATFLFAYLYILVARVWIHNMVYLYIMTTCVCMLYLHILMRYELV